MNGSNPSRGQQGNPPKQGTVIPKEHDFYVDFFESRSCLYDIQMIMGRRVTGANDGEREIFIPDLIVRMSPSHLKDFVLMLIERIKAYEEKFGEIPSQFDVENISFKKKPQFEEHPVVPNPFDSSTPHSGSQGGGVQC